MAQMNEWVVIVTDNKGVLENRLKLRPDHVKNLKSDIDSGFWVMGGLSLDDVPKDDEGLQVNGSVMLAMAATKAEVMEKLQKDIYCQSGVWDMGKLRVMPFRSALRKPL